MLLLARDHTGIWGSDYCRLTIRILYCDILFALALEYIYLKLVYTCL